MGAVYVFVYTLYKYIVLYLIIYKYRYVLTNYVSINKQVQVTGRAVGLFPWRNTLTPHCLGYKLPVLLARCERERDRSCWIFGENLLLLGPTATGCVSLGQQVLEQPFLRADHLSWML